MLVGGAAGDTVTVTLEPYSLQTNETDVVAVLGEYIGPFYIDYDFYVDEDSRCPPPARRGGVETEEKGAARSGVSMRKSFEQKQTKGVNRRDL